MTPLWSDRLDGPCGDRVVPVLDRWVATYGRCGVGRTGDVRTKRRVEPRRRKRRQAAALQGLVPTYGISGRPIPGDQLIHQPDGEPERTDREHHDHQYDRAEHRAD